MHIRAKILSAVLPLMIGALIISGASAFFIATNSVSQVTSEFMDFKTEQLSQYIEGQWRILSENDLTARQDMVQAAQAGVEVFARSLLRSETELIFALDTGGRTVMSTSPPTISEDEARRLLAMTAVDQRSLSELEIQGTERVGSWFAFEPFEWRVFVTETRETFYSDLNRITAQTVIFTVGAALVAAAVIFLLIATLMRPVRQLVGTMRSIISSNDLSSRVDVHFQDEIGELSKTFNVMVSALDKAYGRIKTYAYDAVLSQTKERRIRNIFQKYVPQELIDQFFANPESMLVGDNRELPVLFSDIRGFTGISEGLQPEVLVASLNRYFSVMVELIYERQGVIDKYIGDAIMAFFGAPVNHENDALNSVEAGIAMVGALGAFNQEQARLGLPEFHIGVGINYGTVTVGNVGTDRKMDYTVMGDTVNVASRLEGLTKVYHEPLIISEFLREKIGDAVPTRIVDSVAVKGRAAGVRIYGAKGELSLTEATGWKRHDQAMESYYKRQFYEGIQGFEEVKEILGQDFLADMMIERCGRYIQEPPPADWSGVEVMTSK